MDAKYSGTIKSKIIILVLWLALYSLLILAINRISRLPVERSADYSQRLEMIGNDLVRIEAAKNAFLHKYQNENNSLESASIQQEENTKEIIQKTANEIDYLGAAHKIRRDSSLLRIHDNFSLNFSEYSANLLTLIRTIREKGNAYTGLTSQWLNLGDQIYQLSANLDEEINRQLFTIRELETMYLQNHSTRNLEEIITIAEGTLYMEGIEESVDVQESIYDYIALTERLININNRLQTSENGGLMWHIENSNDNTLRTYNQLQSGFNTSLARSSMLLGLAGYILISIIFLSIAYGLLNISDKLITKPLKSIVYFADMISQGSLSDKKLEISVNNELGILSQKLNRVAEGLRDKYHFTKALNENDFSVSHDLIDEQDILGNELIAMKNRIEETTVEQAKNNEENLRRRYINEGLAKFAEILRANNNDIKALGDIFIQNTVKYLKAIQGGLFLLSKPDDNEPVLSLASAFAYDRKKYLEKTIALGEGLIGTCAIEKSTVNLTEIPEGYISITSGLGDTPPGNLLLIPVIHENELIGVIEIASLNKFKDFEITFADEVAKSLAAALIYTRNNDRTNELLKKSQQQAAEMAEQEEEMRQNMEELKATQEESSRREEEYRGVVEAIENSMFIVEYDSQGMIINANENLCTFLGKNLDEITGKSHQAVLNGSLNPDETFWAEVREKTYKTEVEKIETNRKTEKLKENFAAVSNANGDLKKYMNFIIIV